MDLNFKSAASEFSNLRPLAVSGCCEFAAELVFQGASGRKCKVDKTICAERNYSDFAVYEKCFLRARGIAEKKKKEVPL